MKKLLAPLTLLLLVACEPSELERCVKANIKSTPTNNYKIKTEQFSKNLTKIFSDKGKNTEDKKMPDMLKLEGLMTL